MSKKKAKKKLSRKPVKVVKTAKVAKVVAKPTKVAKVEKATTVSTAAKTPKIEKIEKTEKIEKVEKPVAPVKVAEPEKIETVEKVAAPPKPLRVEKPARAPESGARAERRATLLLASVAIVFCVVLILPFAFKKKEVDENHCPLGGETSARATMVLVDLTSDIPLMKRGGILSATKQIISSLEKHERFSLFVLRPSKTREFMPVFSACNPGVPEWSDYLTKGRRQLKTEFEKGFADKMEEAFNRELASKQEAQTSPIIEAIRDISQSQYWAKQNRMIIFSDLIEHSSLTSLYRKEQTFKDVLRSPARFVVNSIDLRDSTVAVCPSDHPADKIDLAVQANALEFFRGFFAHTHARCLSMGCQKVTQACN